MRVQIHSALVGTVLLAAVLAGLAACSTVRFGQHPYSSMLKAGNESVEVRYLLYLPDAYGKDRSVKWPLVLFLHGRGECGKNLELLKKHPLPKTLESRSDFPFIVVSPQLLDSHYGWDNQLELLNALLLQVQARHTVDPTRVYVTGISMGGAGTWQMALRYPRRFAAIVPIAGFSSWGSREVPPRICDLRDLPIWVFHGARDSSVQLYQEQILVDALRACGSKVQFTVYEDAGHEDTWRKAYADPALFEWMLAQTLK